jgi:hypothetical protein
VSDEPELEYHDLDRDGIPDVLDVQVDPAPVDVFPLDVPLTDEELLETQRRAEQQAQMESVLTNIANTRHESAKSMADKLRG